MYIWFYGFLWDQNVVLMMPHTHTHTHTHTYIYMYIIMLGDSGPADIWWPAHVAHTLQQLIVVSICVCYYYDIMILCDPKRRYWPFESYGIRLIYRKKKYIPIVLWPLYWAAAVYCVVFAVFQKLKNVTFRKYVFHVYIF